jgi:hypothetical protein
MGDEDVGRSRGGSWIVRHTAAGGGREPAWQAGGFHDELGDVLAAAFAEPFALHWVLEDGEHIDIWVVPPNERRAYQTLVTAGMSDNPMTVPDGYEERARLELTLSLPANWTLTNETMKSERVFWPVRLLRNLALYPRRYATFLDVTHTVPNGDEAEPYALNTNMMCALIAPSPFAEPEPVTIRGSDGRVVQFASVIPIYRDEMEFKLAHGAAALLERLHAAGMTDVLDVKRRSVCRARRFGFFS